MRRLWLSHRRAEAALEVEILSGGRTSSSASACPAWRKRRARTPALHHILKPPGGRVAAKRGVNRHDGENL